MNPQYFKITRKHEFLSIYFKRIMDVYTWTHLHILLPSYKIQTVEHLNFPTQLGRNQSSHIGTVLNPTLFQEVKQMGAGSHSAVI